MGWSDRFKKILAGTVRGAYETAQAPFGLVKDLAVAPFADDEYDGFVGTVVGSGKDRFGQAVGGLFGEGSGLEQLVGGLPETGIRDPAAAVGRGLEAVWRETISEPISTAVTAASLADSPEYLGREPGFFDTSFLQAQTWKDAYAIAQDRSPGQAVAAAADPGNVDIADPEAMEKFQKSNFEEVVSGLTDAGLRIQLDPTVLAGKGQKAARLKLLTKPIDAATDFDKVAKSRRVQQVAQKLAGKTADEIRNQFVPDHRQGASISTVLANAGTAEEITLALRGMMGDVKVIDEIGRRRADVAQQIRRTLGDKQALGILDEGAMIGKKPDGSWGYADEAVNVPDEIARLDAELDSLYGEQNLLEHRNATVATLSEQPRLSLPGKARASHFYQSSSMSAPLHVIFDQTPHHLVNLDDLSGDVQVDRMLKKSGMPNEQRGALRSEYMAAFDSHARQQVLLKAETAAVENIASKAGMTADEVQGLLAEATKSRSTAQQMLASRAHDGEGRSKIRLHGDGPPVDLPIFHSQDANILPIVDLDAVKRATTPIGRFRLRHPTADIPVELLNDLYRIWKPAQLLRGAWTAKVILDEQLRMLAILGPMAQAKGLTTVVGNGLRRAKAKVDGGDAEWVPGAREKQVMGYTRPGAFEDRVFKSRASSRDSFDATLGRNDNGLLVHHRPTGQWAASVMPDSPAYARDWENAVNRQIGSDRFARRILMGESAADIRKWMDMTADGQKYARTNPVRARDIDQWIDVATDQINAYLPTPELRQLALKGRATAKDLSAAIPDRKALPPVHGEVLAQALGNGQTTRFVKKAVEKAYLMMGSLPSDVLSRQPFFDAMYQAEWSRQVKIIGGQRRNVRLTKAELDDISARSREYALGETKSYLYDLAEQSRLSHTLKFIAPFYNAWQEVLTVWGDIAVTQNPAFVARMQMAFRSPEKAGLVVTDEDGNERVQLPIPEGVKDLPWLGEALENQGSMLVNLESLNYISSLSMPGVGPVVQLPAHVIMKDRPELSESTAGKFMFPFGQPRNMTEILLPAYGKRLVSRVQGEDDRAYRNALIQIWTTQVVDFNTQKRSTPPSWEEAKEDANALMQLRFATAWFSPAAISFQSPYQLEIDKYRALRDDPETAENADAIFIADVGEDYFPLTQAMSRSTDGVPATVEGMKARGRYEDLIETYPELGGLIVGSEGVGAWSQSVFEQQRRTALSSESDLMQREPLSKEEIAKGPNVRLGWDKYSEAMDTITAELHERGLSNMMQADAADLRELKRDVVADLKRRYPEWYDEFSVTDRSKWEKKIKALTAISADPRLQTAARPEMRGLAEYLEKRKIITDELAKRPAKAWNAVSNQDLRDLWDDVIADLTERNVAFSPLYLRYLENDPMESS